MEFTTKPYNQHKSLVIVIPKKIWDRYGVTNKTLLKVKLEKMNGDKE